MPRDFNNDDLELFIKQKADQYQIYPSDRVWKGIYHSLYPKGKWFTLGGTLLLITALFFLSHEFLFSGPTSASVKGRPVINAKTINTSLLIPRVPSIKSPVSNSTPHALFGSNAKTVAAGDNTADLRASSIATNAPAPRGSYDIERSLSRFNTVENADNETIIRTDLPGIDESVDPALVGTSDLAVSATDLTVSSTDLMIKEPISSNELNWLQEMAAIKLTPTKLSRFNLQIYFSPTISYRRLADNNNSMGSNQIPMSASHLNVDRFVDHKPSIGVELGSNILFAAGRNLTLKTGVQLNYSRYNIKAYKFYYEKASIALNAVGPIADTITAYTSIRNFNGYSPEQLQNQYLQVSVPVGAELKLLGNKRLQFNVAGTVQPTFLLFNDIYLLSTDYVNYAQEPSLVRKWNVHTSVEAFLSYKLGGIRWQVGPQFRYQLMSSYNDRYPIKEYLMEYGVKFGISKTLK